LKRSGEKVRVLAVQVAAIVGSVMIIAGLALTGYVVMQIQRERRGRR
jgi:hypothetical protein